VSAALDADLALAFAAVMRAGVVVMRWFGTDLVVTEKAPDQPLTAADLAADAVLREELGGARPGYGWLSEETADSPERLGRERAWIVDPIDGTRSFIAGRREFAISVGLVEGGAALLGIVLNPASGELYWAVRGGGAWRQQPGGAPVRSHRLSIGAAAEPVLLASRSELAAGEFEPFARDWRLQPAGSTAYKLALVAEGAGAFLSRGPKSEWDICAGALIVAEAGGRVTDLQGREPGYNRPDPYVHGILAADPATHARLLSLCRELPPAPRLRADAARD
jgi:myo-inositol-1(or 4)-monophosphatase